MLATSRRFLQTLCLTVAILGPVVTWGQFTDGLNVAFGKNRVQTRDFQWQYYTQGMFEVYHYQEGAQVAGQVARMLESEASSLSPMFGRALEGPIQVGTIDK